MSDRQGSVSKQTVPLISTQNSFQAQQHKKGKTKKKEKKKRAMKTLRAGIINRGSRLSLDVVHLKEQSRRQIIKVCRVLMRQLRRLCRRLCPPLSV